MTDFTTGNRSPPVVISDTHDIDSLSRALALALSDISKSQIQDDKLINSVDINVVEKGSDGLASPDVTSTSSTSDNLAKVGEESNSEDKEVNSAVDIQTLKNDDSESKEKDIDIDISSELTLEELAIVQAVNDNEHSTVNVNDQKEVVSDPER